MSSIADNLSGGASRVREWLRSELARSKLFRKIPVKHIEVLVMLIGGINTYLILAYREEIVSFLEHSFLVLIEKVHHRRHCRYSRLHKIFSGNT